MDTGTEEMGKSIDSKEPLWEWTPDLLEAAKTAIIEVLAELPSGEMHDLAARIVERVAAASTDPIDEDALIDELEPFDLLDCVGGESAEDDSAAFMGPNWCSFSAYKLAHRKYLIVEDRIEAGGYEVYGSASSLKEVSTLLHEAVIDRIGSVE